MFFNLFNYKNTYTDDLQDLSRKRDAFDEHLAIGFKIEEEYKKRNTDTDSLNKTIALCYEQIKISDEAKNAWLKENRDIGIKDETLPYHRGYRQLAIIFEKQGKLQDAINIAKQAKLQGWSGDWDQRIKRCEQKLLKINQ